jgi:hypothetical protein
MTVRARTGRLALLFPIGSALAVFLCLVTVFVAASTASGVKLPTTLTPDVLAMPVMLESPGRRQSQFVLLSLQVVSRRPRARADR